MTCQVPPPGWSCSRKAGHDGPCAASPTANLPRIPPKHLKDGCYARADALEAHLNAANAEIARLRGEAEVADEQLAQLRGFAEAHKTCRGADETESKLLAELKAIKTLIDRADIVEGHRRKCLVWKGETCDCRVGIAMKRIEKVIADAEARSPEKASGEPSTQCSSCALNRGACMC